MESSPEPLAAEPVGVDGVPEEEAPRRVHPGTIGLWFLKKAPQNVLGLPAIIGVSSGRGLRWILLAAAVIGAAMLVWTWLGWRRFTYAITDREVVIERGILNRTRRSIPLQRIQDVSIEQGPLARIFGLAEVRIETGGGEKDEGVLDSVSLAEARRLRATLRGMAVQAEAAATPSAATPMAESGEGAGDFIVSEAAPMRVVFTMSPARILLLGAFSFSLVWIAALFGMFQFVDQFIDFGWDQVRDWATTAEDQVRARFSLTAALALAGFALLLGVVSGIVRTALREWGFTLRFGGGRFRRTRGLLTRTEVVVAARRVQLALIQRGPLRGLLGWNSLSFQTLGGSNDANGRQVMAPLARPHETAAIVNLAGIPPFERLPLRPVAARHIQRSLLQSVPLPLIAIVAAALFFSPLAWLALLIVPPIALTAILQRRFHRYATRETSYQVMRGVIQQRDWIVPYENVQVVSLEAGWLQRLLGLATVRVDTAGAGVVATPDVVDLTLEDARSLATGLAARID